MTSRYVPFMWKVTVAVCLLTLVTAVGGHAAPAAPELDNGCMCVTFDAGTGQLVRLLDHQTGHEFVDTSQPEGLWQIGFLQLSQKDGIEPRDAQEFHWTALSGDQQALELVWQGFGLPDALNLRVIAHVSLAENEPVAYWRFAVEGIEGLRLSTVRYPRLPRIAAQDNEVLAAPVWMGEKMDRPRDTLCAGDSPRRLGWENPGTLSLQCITLYREGGPGLYLASDDTAAYAKRFCVFSGAQQGLGFELAHLPESDSQNAGQFTIPYQAITGTFEGDWFTVAERYRRWGLEQPWTATSRLGNGTIADWAQKTGLWVWNRGRSGGVLGPAIALQERAGLPVSVFWHWWHGCSYDTGFPEYLPPREGEEAFRAALEQAHAAGVHAIVYMNQRLWGMTTRSWEEEGAERYAVKGADGAVRPEVYNTFTKAPCASMCMGTPFWRGKYAGLAEQAVTGLGVDGIYMDQACSSLACYDPDHGHPIGGGTYWLNGFRLLQADIRERCAPSRTVVLAGEGCGEAWLPHLDLMLSLQVSMERYAAPGVWEPIPFFHAVYHGQAIFFGNYSSLTMPPYDDLWPAEFAPKEPLALLDRAFAQQFRLEQARAFVWGQQPTIANFLPSHFDERPEEIDYVVRLAKLRLHAVDYLLHGKMLRPPVVDLPEEEIDISRLSIYAGQQDALKQYRKRCPAVLVSAWQAPSGGVGLVMANVMETPQRFAVKLDPAEHPVPEDSRIVSITEDGEVESGAALDNERVLQVDLEPAGARIYVFTRG